MVAHNFFYNKIRNRLSRTEKWIYLQYLTDLKKDFNASVLSEAIKGAKQTPHNKKGENTLTILTKEENNF